MNSINYCSPSNNNTNKKTCYSKKSLLDMIKIWNKIYKNNKIIYKITYTLDKLWNLLNDKFKTICNDKNDLCWIDILKKKTHDLKLKAIEQKELKPQKPIEWVNNPT